MYFFNHWFFSFHYCYYCRLCVWGVITIIIIKKNFLPKKITDTYYNQDSWSLTSPLLKVLMVLLFLWTDFYLLFYISYNYQDLQKFECQIYSAVGNSNGFDNTLILMLKYDFFSFVFLFLYCFLFHLFYLLLLLIFIIYY